MGEKNFLFEAYHKKYNSKRNQIKDTKIFKNKMDRI